MKKEYKICQIGQEWILAKKVREKPIIIKGFSGTSGEWKMVASFSTENEAKQYLKLLIFS